MNAAASAEEFRCFAADVGCAAAEGAEGRGGGDLGVGEVVDDGRLAAGTVGVEDVVGAGDVCRGG